MKTIDEIRRDNLLIAIQRMGKASALAEKANLAAAYLSQIKNQTPDSKTGKPKNMGDEAARKIENALGEATGWMDTEHSFGFSDSSNTGQNSDIIKRLLPEDKGNVIAWEEEGDLPEDPNRVWVDRYDYHFSAGSGLIQWEVREKHSLPFTMSFFKAKGARPKDCKLLMLRGDSMEPWAEDKNMIMVDISATRIMDGEKYAIYFEDEPLVKQLFKEVGGGIRLHSFNSKYPDRMIPADKLELVVIVGKVIYRSG